VTFEKQIFYADEMNLEDMAILERNFERKLKVNVIIINHLL